MRVAMPNQEQADEIRKALIDRDETAQRLKTAANPAEIARTAGAYLDATDRLFEAQKDVPRGFACSR